MKSRILVLWACLAAVFLTFFLVPVLSAQQSSSGQIPITTKSDEARKLFIEARDKDENYRLQEARELYSKAIEMDPGFALAHAMRAVLADATADTKTDFEKAAQYSAQASDGERLIIQAGIAFTVENDAKKGASLYEKLAQLYPKDKRSFYYLGTGYYYYLREYTKAISELEKSIALDKEFGPAYVSLGYAAYLNKQYGKAEDAFKTYIRLKPNLANPYDCLGDLYMKLGRFDEAIASYKKAVDLDQTFAASQQKMGACLAFQKKFEEARAAIEKASSMTKLGLVKLNASAAFYRTYLYEMDYPKALEAIDRTTSMARDMKAWDAVIFQQEIKWLVLLEMADFAQATKSISECKETCENPDLPAESKAYYGKYIIWWDGYTAAMKKDFATASARAQEFKVVKVPDLYHEKNYNALLGFISLGRGANTEAIRHFKQSDPENPYVLFYWAVAEAKSGHKDAAQALFKKAVDINADDPLYALIRPKALKELSL